MTSFCRGSELASHILLQRLSELANVFRSFFWAGYEMAPIMSHGEQIGWGCTCKRHHNDAERERADPPVCKKQLTFGSGEDKFSPNFALRLMKTWALMGEDISDEGDARDAHVQKIKLRTGMPLPEELLAVYDEERAS